MAEFLTTSGVTYNLERLINEATERLILVSPYLKINDRLRQLLEDRDRFKIDIRVIYGKSELQPSESKWLGEQSSIRSSYCKNLHAKCFLNESEALITSMNLYEFSQVNNQEMGILIKKVDDPELYLKVYEETSRLIRISEEVRVEVEIVPPEPTKKPAAKKAGSKKVAAEQGHCIRCGTDIPFGVERPLCDKDYRTWSRYEDVDYEEGYCHSCGEERDTTYARPLCRTCWSKHGRPKPNAIMDKA
ncbi:MAG: hypothetical protein HQ478_06425 [Chloroflexi bacterium]|nr:hypothetical protein [Chloroflexota bacterium]